MAQDDKGKSFPKAELLQLLNSIATQSEGKGNASRGAAIRELIKDLNSDKIDAAQVKLKGRVRLQKFAGVRGPADDPVEVQEFITEA